MSGWEDVPRAHNGEWTGTGKAAFHRDQQQAHLARAKQLKVTKADNDLAARFNAGIKRGAYRVTVNLKADKAKPAAPSGKYKSIAAAVAAAKGLGVKLKDDSGDLQVVGKVVDGLAAAKKYGATLPPEAHLFPFGKTDAGTKAQMHVPYGKPGAAKAASVLEVNSSARDWKMSPAEADERFHLDGHFSTGDPNHLLFTRWATTSSS
jgi:hypothetical protein